MLKGFKEFLFRGNIVDLAVAVVIGTAFAKVVEVFVSSIVTPLLNVLAGSKSEGLGFQITSNPQTFVNVSAILNALVVFFLTAAVVYFVFVLPVNKMKERGLLKTPEEAVDPAVTLLGEIRDELRARR